VWSRSISVTLGGDESYYRDPRLCNNFHPLQVSEKDFYYTRSVSVITLISSIPVLVHTTRLCNNFHLLQVSEKDFYSTRPVSVITFISSNPVSEKDFYSKRPVSVTTLKVITETGRVEYMSFSDTAYILDI
jgi:hypothetical protein